MPIQYALNIKHSGTDAGSFCIYQTYDEQPDNIRSLAWFSKSAHPGTALRFQWDIDYGFACSETGMLQPGVVFSSSQIKSANPNYATQNTTGFSMQSGACQLIPSNNPTQLGKLGIDCDASVPYNSASVGIAMSGKPIFACMASPSLKITFATRPRYWVAFGRFEVGEVIDLNRMTRKCEIRFPVNNYQSEVVLQSDNTLVCTIPCGVTKTDSFDVTVELVAVLEEIKITTMPTKTVYIAGETLDLTGMVVTAYYSDGSSKPVPDYVTFPSNGTILNDAGQHTIMVSYTEYGTIKTVSL